MIRLCTLLLLTLAAFAHDPKLHKGKAISGEIVSIATDGFAMKTATGNLAVKFDGKTKFEHGNDKATSQHLKKGERVSVIGTRLATGELVAREVMIGATPGHHAKK